MSRPFTAPKKPLYNPIEPDHQKNPTEGLNFEASKPEIAALLLACHEEDARMFLKI